MQKETEQKDQEYIEQLLAGNYSPDEMIFMLKKELILERKKLREKGNENDRISEMLRIKERELASQFEENDQLRFNYERLKKRMTSLQADLKSKKESQGIFGGFFKKSDELQSIQEQLRLSQEQLGRTIQDNGIPCLTIKKISQKSSKIQKLKAT